MQSTVICYSSINSSTKTTHHRDFSSLPFIRNRWERRLLQVTVRTSLTPIYWKKRKQDSKDSKPPVVSQGETVLCHTTWICIWCQKLSGLWPSWMAHKVKQLSHVLFAQEGPNHRKPLRVAKGGRKTSQQPLRWSRGSAVTHWTSSGSRL